MPELEEKKVTVMFNEISKTYDRVNSILSFGIHHIWKRKLLSHIPFFKMVSLLDIASGTGDILLKALKTKKASSGVGLDLAEKMLEIGRAKAKEYGLDSKAQFCLGNALNLPFSPNTFHCVTCSFGIRNVQDPLKALKEAHRVLKSKGRVLILEFSIPQNKLLRKLHLFYLRYILPKVGGFFSKSPSSYLYLNETIEKFPHGEVFLNLLSVAGFKITKAIPLFGGIATLYRGDK
jgi:demethylmenaquinone methyltransferase/2-methoxy-6-polyprenyl-1,4-benzoquinol methylase